MKYIIIILSLFSNINLSAKKNDNLEKQPNIVFFLIDDLGWMDLGYQGSTIFETPNIDKLSEQSVVFNNGYSCHALCLPSRAGIMTGQYPAKMGIPAKRYELTKDEDTFAQYLKESGYKTFFIGKWHIGKDPEMNYPIPKGFGSSFAAGRAGSPRQFFAPYNHSKNKPWNEKKTPIPDVDKAPVGEYLNDRLTDETIKFIDKSKGEPFMVMLSHYAVHEPLQAPAELIKKYEDKIANSTFPDFPDYLEEGTGLTKMKQDNAVYAAMLDNLDENVGKILDYLKDNGLDENTIIIFTSDNGGLSNHGTSKRTMATSNYPLRAGKGWMYEGGIRVPLLIKWPGQAKAGINDKQVVSGIDFYPTIIEMATGKRVDSDGMSLVPILKNKKQPDRGPVYWYSPKPRKHTVGDAKAIAVRDGDYKLIHWLENDKIELFDLRNDIGEQNNLVNEMPKKVKELVEKLDEWRKDIVEI